jgi:hypothetical protein
MKHEFCPECHFEVTYIQTPVCAFCGNDFNIKPPKVVNIPKPKPMTYNHFIKRKKELGIK